MLFYCLRFFIIPYFIKSDFNTFTAIHYFCIKAEYIYYRIFIKYLSDRGYKSYKLSGILLKCILRAVLDTFHTQNTFCAVCPLPWIIGNINIHRTDSLAFTAVNTPVLITSYPQQRKIAHRFQEYCNRADIFTKTLLSLKENAKAIPIP